MNCWHPPKIWDGGECFIIGGGPSIPKQFNVPENIINDVMMGLKSPSEYSPYLEALHDKHIIGINNAYKIGIWIDILFFGDNSWYLVHKRKLALWPGIKISCAPRFQNQKDDSAKIKYMPKNRNHRYGISKNNGSVSWNGNSGAASISLAAQLGVKRIILLGFDMCLNNGHSHWFGSHAKNRRSPPFKRHLKGFPQIAKDAKNLGIELLNASPDSSIDKKLIKKINIKNIL